MIEELTELDDLLNTLETSSLEPHSEYSMSFTNHEQTIIWNYINNIIAENKKLKSYQKEYINLLEKEICDSKTGSGQQYYTKEHLQKYKDIIGSD